MVISLLLPVSVGPGRKAGPWEGASIRAGDCRSFTWAFAGAGCFYGTDGQNRNTGSNFSEIIAFYQGMCHLKGKNLA